MGFRFDRRDDVALRPGKRAWMRAWWGAGRAGLLVGSLSASCFNSGGGSSTYTGAENEVPRPVGAAIGEACTGDSTCRTGLVCSSGACAPGHTVAIGGGCFLNSDCAAGAYCKASIGAMGPVHQCTARNVGGGAGSDAGGGSGGAGAAAPAGTVGASCQGDADCGDGLRCGLVGLGAACIPEGSGDLSSACTTSNDCLGGLACTAMSAPRRAGGAALRPSHMGRRDVRSRDRPCDRVVSGAARHRRQGLLPSAFPERHSDEERTPGPFRASDAGAELLGFDVVDRYLRAIEADNDGFSTYPTVTFRFSSFIDVDSWRKDKAVQWVDLSDKGSQRGLYWDAETSRTNYVCPYWLAVRPSQGEPLTPGHTYAVLLTSVGKAEGGAAFAQSPDLAAVLGAAAPPDAALLAAYAAYKPLRDYLASQSMTASSVVNAAVFTVGHVQRVTEKLPAAIAAAGVPAPTTWVKCGSGAPSPCPDATGRSRLPGERGPAFDELHALISLPIFQKGTAPYLTPDQAAKSIRPQSAPTVERTEQVCVALTVPKGATMPAAGWPLVVYAHGTGGSFRSHVTEGVAKAMATRDEQGQRACPSRCSGSIRCSTGRGAARPRCRRTTSSSTSRTPRPRATTRCKARPIRSRSGTLAATLDIAAASSPTGAEFKFDPAALAFWGHSQGSTEGGIAVPFVPGLQGSGVFRPRREPHRRALEQDEPGQHRGRGALRAGGRGPDEPERGAGRRLPSGARALADVHRSGRPAQLRGGRGRRGPHGPERAPRVPGVRAKRHVQPAGHGSNVRDRRASWRRAARRFRDDARRSRGAPNRVRR